MRTLRAVASLSLTLFLAAPAPAHNTGGAPASAMSRLNALAAELGVGTEPVLISPVTGTTGPEAPVPTAETLVNFEYGDIIERLEQTRRTIYQGRGRRRRAVEVPVNSGVITADRVARGQVTEIVLHASLGSGACEGTVNYLLRVRQAAHFMVCRTGRVYQMVEIEDIANHVKSAAAKARSVGIETESGHLFYTDPRGRSARAVTEEQVFWTEDWDPRQYWIMYASLAGVIRAVAREARIPRDLAHIRTHEAVDAGEADGHSDPGGIFDGSRNHVYPEFAQRYQGQNVSPFQWLMRLVQDDTPPAIVSVLLPGGGNVYRVRDTENLGLAYVRVWRYSGTPGPNVPKVKIAEWAAMPGAFPDAMREVSPPTQPGDYSIIARDLVGNITGVQVRVEGAPGAVPGSAPIARLMGEMSAMQLASYEEPAPMGGGSMPSNAFAAP